jgi:hypothetical protein
LWFRALGTSVDLSINYIDIDVEWQLKLINTLMLKLFTSVECCRKKYKTTGGALEVKHSKLSSLLPVIIHLIRVLIVFTQIFHK